MGISTHKTGLTGRIAQAAAGVVNKSKKLYTGARKVAPTLKNEIGDRAQTTKKGFFGMRRSLTAVFKRPLSDISHLSIVMVIALALFSGLSTMSLGAGNISSNLFHPKQQAATQYVSADQQEILDADLVTTLASIHSDSLGADAAAVTQGLYQKESSLAGDMTTITTTPVLAPTTSASTAGKVTKYLVQDGDTLSQIASKFNISTDTVRYANSLDNADSIKPGVELTILPVSGILYTTKGGDTIASVASNYGLSQDVIIAQNDLYGEELTSGMQIVLPDAEIPAAPTPVVAAPAATSTSSSSSSDDGSAGISYVKTSTGPNRFPYGWCTWWVAQKRYVPWSGNASDWFYNAQAYGRPEGQRPIVGAIMVTWESGWGHVAYVESVSGNSFTVSEMNYKGFGIVSERTLTTSQVPLIGFIY